MEDSRGLSLPLVLGYDVAGVVTEVGAGVADLQRGDEVYYTPEIVGNQLGSYAEYNTVKAAIAARKLAALSFTEAAAVPLAGGIAWEAVVRRLHIRVGDTILIHGAAGGVGSFAIQFAKAAGARVLATASASHQSVLKDLGADAAIDYRSADAADVALQETDGEGVDAAFDIEGDDLVSRCLKGVRPMGRVACILPPQGDLTLLYQKNITLHGVFLHRERARLDEMRPVFERGLAFPLVDQVLPLEKVSKAHERLDSRHGRGKVVLQVAR